MLLIKNGPRTRSHIQKLTARSATSSSTEKTIFRNRPHPGKISRANGAEVFDATGLVVTSGALLTCTSHLREAGAGKFRKP